MGLLADVSINSKGALSSGVKSGGLVYPKLSQLPDNDCHKMFLLSAPT